MSTRRTDVLDPLDPLTTAALRSLDPAAQVDPEASLSVRAQESLTWIMASDPAPGALGADGRATRPSPRRGWALAGATLVGAGALTVGPAMLGGQGAYATWSAIPSSAPAAVAAAAGQDCYARHNHDGPPDPQIDRDAAHDATAVLVERRGQWTYVLLDGPRGFEATCLLRNNGDGKEVTGGGYVGTLGTEPPAPDSMTTHGTRTQSDDQSSYREISGRVGSEVTAVVLNTLQQGRVRATVSGGHFAAWWPGPPVQDPEGPGPEPTVTITLRDGTVRADIPMSELDLSPIR
jgi:hypothetical protein